MPSRSPARFAAPRRKRHTYNLRLIKRDFSYTIHEVAELFGLHPNAVRRWAKAGLVTIDDRKPQLIHGTDLFQFLSGRQRARKQHCAPDEMFCCRCRVPRRPAGHRVVADRRNESQLMIRGVCEICGTRMNRGGLLTRLPEIERTFTVTTAPPRLEETSDPAVVCQFK